MVEQKKILHEGTNFRMGVTRPKQQHSKARWSVVFTLVVVALAGLAAILGALAADLLYPGGVPAAAAWVFGTDLPQSTGIAKQISQTPSLTPFGPLPTSTITPTPTATPTPTNTSTSTNTPEPTNTPTLPPPTNTSPPPEPIYPEDSVIIGNITGYPQSYNLSCESRSAVDWARYFGVSIGETEFLEGLPKSDDPNRGFVGSVYDMPGQIPPNGYGVHADPVARLLRAYGLPAESVYRMGIEDIKKEINHGQPVIAWVITGTMPGYPLTYHTEDGDDVTVAPFEHTVIIIGYDPTGVTVLDGAWVYWRSWDTFMASFGVLGNMGIVYQ